MKRLAFIMFSLGWATISFASGDESSMMNSFGYHSMGRFSMMLFMIVFWVLIILIIISLLKWIFKKTTP